MWDVHVSPYCCDLNHDSVKASVCSLLHAVCICQALFRGPEFTSVKKTGMVRDSWKIYLNGVRKNQHKREALHRYVTRDIKCCI